MRAGIDFSENDWWMLVVMAAIIMEECKEPLYEYTGILSSAEMNRAKWDLYMSVIIGMMSSDR